MPPSQTAKQIGERPIESIKANPTIDGAVIMVGMDIRTSIAKDILIQYLQNNPNIDPNLSLDQLTQGSAKFSVLFTDALLEELAK